MESYDLIVIGAGPGGTPAAMAAAKFGKSVLLVDKRDKPGGECLFEGCIPSKILENAANRYEMLKNISEFHIEMKGGAQIHWEAVLKEKENLLNKRSTAALSQLKSLSSLTFKQGTATFVDEHTVEINSEKFSFEHAIIATGAKAHLPSFEGNGAAKVWTNADVFKNKTIPKEMVFIGGGAISCELVQMFNKLGTKCHILERSDRILKRIDKECALNIQQKMINDGIEIDLNVKIKKIDKNERDFTIKYLKDAEERTLTCTNVLTATGRAANVEDLGLEKIGIKYIRSGIVVNKMLQTSLPHIYAVGDCNIGPKFAHWATYESGIALHNIYAPGRKHETDISKLSWVLFTDPQIASVGLSEEEAKEAGIDINVEKYDYMIDARAQIDKDTVGFLKFVIEQKSGVIIGIEILNKDASSLVGEASLIVANKMKILDVVKAIHPHPTLTESFGFLAKNSFFKSMLAAKKRVHESK